MKRLLIALPLLAMLLGAAKVSRTSITAMEESIDKQLGSLFPEEPVIMVGVTQGAYISGYGVVFTGELNLVPAAGITPFHPTISKEEVARTHQKEVERLPRFRQAMQTMLVSSAASLDTVPIDEQVALAISLFHFHWENLTGVPSQIVMHALRKNLVAVSAGRADKSVITVEEF